MTHDLPVSSHRAALWITENRWMFVLCLIILLAVCAPAFASETQAERNALAIADAALEAVNDEDRAALANLMIEEGVLFVASERDGKPWWRARSQAEERTVQTPGDVLERAFDPTVMVSGSVAMVWYPYDLWVDGDWIHCGVNIFSLLQTDAGWRIASVTYSADQPPVCSLHPDGPLE